MAEHEYKFEVVMTCGGCSGAVTRVLSKLEGEWEKSGAREISRRRGPASRRCLRAAGNSVRKLARADSPRLFPAAPAGVSSFDVSLETQTVVVKGTAPYETVLEKIKKTGKEVKKGEVIA